MATPELVNLPGLLDDVTCFAFVRQQRWPKGARRVVAWTRPVAPGTGLA